MLGTGAVERLDAHSENVTEGDWRTASDSVARQPRPDRLSTNLYTVFALRRHVLLNAATFLPLCCCRERSLPNARNVVANVCYFFQYTQSSDDLARSQGTLLENRCVRRELHSFPSFQMDVYAMNKALLLVANSICFLGILTSDVAAWPIGEEELKDITESYKRWWDNDLEMHFEKLPKSGMVGKHRIPWAGHIYPDRAGGCYNVLLRYDQAFHGGRALAANFERHDIAIHRTSVSVTRRGLFGRAFSSTSYGTPHWAGHCNGWTAATIRHAEPQRSVTRNGVVFRPSDIKGLLAELYIYCDIELLGGSYEGSVNPATLHLMLTNWVANGHPIGMDSTLGREIWNYPIYSFKSNSAKRGDRQVEVRTNIGFVNSTDREYDKAPKRYKFLSFHYWLNLDETGKIVGGNYYRDSNQIDLLWAPLRPTRGGTDGNKEGNPYLDPKEVLALWRESVPEEARSSWYNINPWPEDAVVGAEEEKQEAGPVVAETKEEQQQSQENLGDTPVETEPTNTQAGESDSASADAPANAETTVVVNE